MHFFARVHALHRGLLASLGEIKTNLIQISTNMICLWFVPDLFWFLPARAPIFPHVRVVMFSALGHAVKKFRAIVVSRQVESLHKTSGLVKVFDLLLGWKTAWARHFVKIKTLNRWISNKIYFNIMLVLKTGKEPSLFSWRTNTNWNGGCVIIHLLEY